MTFAVGISYAMAVIIGVVVSLDVGGLLISQHKEFRSSPIVLKKSLGHSLLHATTHAALFLLYFYAVGIVIEWPVEIIEWLARLNIFPSINTTEAMRTMLLLSSFIIIIFVWITYAHKISENHAQKTDGSHIATSATRIDITFLYWIAQKFSPGRKSGLFYMALAVAVDMLAITSFIRVFFKTASDASSVGGQTPERLPHFEFSANNPALDPLIFAGVIFVIVLACALVAIIFARSVSDERNKNLLRKMRVAEPFFVFWLLSVAVDHLFGNAIESVLEYAIKILAGAVTAAVLTWLLVAYHGKTKIREYVDSGYDNLDTSILAGSDDADESRIGRTLFTFFVSTLIILLFLILTFFVSHKDIEADFNGVREFVNWGSIIASALSLLILYVPMRSFSEFEIDKSEILHRAQCSNHIGMLGPTHCIAISYFVMLIYIHFSFSGIQIFNATEEEAFLGPLLSLGVVAYFAWVLLWLRSAKANAFVGDNDTKRQDHFKRSLGDFLGAFASVVFIWQISAMMAEL